MLSLRGVSLHVGGKLLLDDTDLNITPGSRIGIVGRNGTGKTHLMQLLAGHISPDSGKRIVAKDVSIVLVKQEMPDDDQTPLDFLRNNDPDIIEAEEALTTASSDTIGQVSDRLSQLDEERYETLAPKVLMGLGLTKEELNQPMRQLSGGMRMRISLAMALVRTPDVLLLDEPTNHLDLEATEWLISYLKEYPPRGAVVMVSHNLAVLKRVTNSTAHLRGGVLTQFSGDYEEYRRQIAVREAQEMRKNAVLEKQADRHEEIYYKFRDLPANRAAQAVQQLKKAEAKRAEIVEMIIEEPVVELNFGEHSLLPNPLVHLDDVTVGYKQPVLSDVSLSLNYGVKVGLIGRNGEGKSTLINLIVSKLAPQKGSIVRAQSLKIGYFSQDSADELNVQATVVEEFVAKTGISRSQDVRSTLARFGFPNEKIGTKIENLSGGEKSRLMFCFICTRTPNLIILDEPTNHLDVETREQLALAIKAYKGTVVLVSHDADLHAQTMDQFWLVNGGKVKVYDRGIVQYQRELQQLIDTLLPSSKLSSLAGKPSSVTGDKKAAKTATNPHRFHQSDVKASTSKTASRSSQEEDDDTVEVSVSSTSQRVQSTASSSRNGVSKKSSESKKPGFK